MAAAYTYQEVRELAATLAADSEPASPLDVSEFVQQAFDDIEAEIANVDKPEAIGVRASRLLANRAARRNQRARRSEAMNEMQVEKVRREERTTAAVQFHELAKAASDDRTELQRQLAAKDDDLAEVQAAADDRVAEQKRITFAACVAIAAVAAAALTGVAGYLTTTSRWIALGCSLVLVSIFCIAYLASTSRWWWLAGGGIAAIAINVLTNVVSQL